MIYPPSMSASMSVAPKNIQLWSKAIAILLAPVCITTPVKAQIPAQTVATANNCTNCEQPFTAQQLSESVEQNVSRLTTDSSPELLEQIETPATPLVQVPNLPPDAPPIPPPQNIVPLPTRLQENPNYRQLQSHCRHQKNSSQLLPPHPLPLKLVQSQFPISSPSNGLSSPAILPSAIAN
jgi:hypothetical protein